jgi:predicted P-loop ATPase
MPDDAITIAEEIEATLQAVADYPSGKLLDSVIADLAAKAKAAGLDVDPAARLAAIKAGKAEAAAQSPNPKSSLHDALFHIREKIMLIEELPDQMEAALRFKALADEWVEKGIPKSTLIRERAKIRRNLGTMKNAEAKAKKAAEGQAAMDDAKTSTDLFGNATPDAEPRAPIAALILAQINAGATGGWMEDLAITDKGGIIPNASNLTLILSNWPSLKNVWAWNELEGTVWMMNRPPWEPGNPKAEFTPRAHDDNDTLLAVNFVQRQIAARAGKETTRDAVGATAVANRINPCSDYLAEARAAWDGKKRLATMATTYLNATAPDQKGINLANLLTRKWMISAAARALNPGCQVDHILLLIGQQGVGKSSALRALVKNPKWHSDSLPKRIDEKDALAHLRSRWIIEIAEADKLRAKEASVMKDFVTKRDDKYRPSYGRDEVDVPRRVVFAATTNSSEPLNDPTGGRRWWPVEVSGLIDIAKIVADRDQLWGEAVDAWERNEPWWLVPEEMAMHGVGLADLQEAATETDAWEPTILRWLAGEFDTHAIDGTEVTDAAGITKDCDRERRKLGPIFVCDVLDHAIGVNVDHRTQADGRRVTQILTRLGWGKSGARHGTKGHNWVPKVPK